MVYQPAFEVPAEIAVRVAAGEYKIWGGVVRDTAGRIVKHLKPVEIQETSVAAMSLSAKAASFAKAHPVLIVVGVAALATMLGYAKAASRSKYVIESIDTTGVDHALASYIEALQRSDLNVAVVDNLLDEIAKLEDAAVTDTVTIEFSSHQLKELVSSVRNYTERLVTGNAELLSSTHAPIPPASDDPLSVLKGCLLTQKAVLNAA